MAYMNMVILIGNLTRNPDFLFTSTGTAYTRFGVALSRYYNNGAREKKKETCIVEAAVWGKQAESCAMYLKKGSLVCIHGRLGYSSWEEDNEKRSRLYVIGESIQFLTSNKYEDNSSNVAERGEGPYTGSVPTNKPALLEAH